MCSFSLDQCSSSIYIIHDTSPIFNSMSSLLLKSFKISRARREEEERVSKSGWNRNMEESLRSIFSTEVEIFVSYFS